MQANNFQTDINSINVVDLNLKNKEKLNIVSLFSGCGGMDLGFRGDFKFLEKYYDENPFNIIFANDIFQQAMEVYSHNFNHEPLAGSIDEIEINDIPKADIVIGGFPCQDFSLAGKRKGLTSERGRLYQHMIRVIKHCEAKAFIAENVDGIRTNKTSETLDETSLDVILRDFQKEGYIVKYKVLNAADYGVPQSRRRVIIMGIKEDIFNGIYYPDTTHRDYSLLEIDNDKDFWVSAKEALEDIWDKIDSPDVLNHTSKHYSKAKFYPGRKMQGNNRISKDKPSCTIRAEHHGNIEAHYNTTLPDENNMEGWRRLSIRECARLQSFPDDFNFVVSTSSAYKMIGNAVPPVMAWHIARALYYTLKCSNELRGEIIMKKYVQKMWMIHDTLFLKEEDALRIEENGIRETVKAVYVGVDEGMDYDLTQVSSDFFGSWIFKTEQEALEEVNEFNQ